MKNLLRHFLPSPDAHLTDDQLASLFCGELSFVQRWAAQHHLKQCWQCRLRKEDLEGRRAPQMFERFRAGRHRGNVSEKARMEFSQTLKRQIQDFAPQETRSVRFPKISFPELSPMNPALVICMVFGFATILSFYFWWQQRAPRISSNALLVRAEKWDTPSLASGSSVVYQAVRITMTHESKKETISRSIYRDTQGKRQPKRVKLNDTEEQLRNTLTQAGLDWDEPLSASGYQSWHDRQHVREDHIARAGAHLLRLTTTLPDGLVEQQSLTVRDTDFHPVRRTVSLRDSGTVEIAEVDFKILPWSAVDANAFEPLESTLPTVVTSPDRVLPFVRLPESLTDGQLDEAELGARLLLNQLHADSGEPVEIHRTPQGVNISGLVETEERKRELESGLRTVPHVAVSIQSVEHLKSSPPTADAVPSGAVVASMPYQPSPLETYLEAQGRSVSDISGLAQRLFRSALTVSQESKEIVDLQTRFGFEDQKTVLASATLSELIYSHHERLQAALKLERELLADARSTSSTSNTSSVSNASSLMDAANRNLALSKELTQTNQPAMRTAEKILAEMSITMDDLTADAQEAYRKAQGNSTLSGKK
jgi:hypothetical protein